MFKVQITYLNSVVPVETACFARIPCVGDSLTGLGSIDKVVCVRLLALRPDQDPSQQITAFVVCDGTDEF